MRLVKIGAVGVLLLCLSLGVAAQRKGSPYQAKVDAFFAELTETRVNAGYDLLLADSPIRKKASAVEALREKTAQALIHSGKPVGTELVKEQKYGESLVRLVYLLKFEQVPLVWEFYFYRAGVGGEWNLINLRFDVDPGLLTDR